MLDEGNEETINFEDTITSPIVLQRFTLTETSTHFFIVGCNKIRSVYRLLIIDRSSVEILEVVEDPYTYTADQIDTRLDSLIARGGTAVEAVSEFAALIGFIPLPKLHLLLITKKKKIGSIGSRWIYKPTEWICKPLQHKKAAEKLKHRENSSGTGRKYRELIKSLEINKDFYFSYGYDITHSLQWNINTRIKQKKDKLNSSNSNITSIIKGGEETTSPVIDQTIQSNTSHSTVLSTPISLTVKSSNVPTSISSASISDRLRSDQSAAPDLTSSPAATPYSYPSPPPLTHTYNPYFLWNLYAASIFLDVLPFASYWLVPFVNGFFKQSLLRLTNTDILITLLARRSRHYAGVRYVKRGIDSYGHVANELETEQILEIINRSSSTPNITSPSFSSVLLLRGSLPLIWYQENSYTLKPNIVISNEQNHYESTIRHFNNLFQRYESPVTVLSLIKKEEKVPQEMRLGVAYMNALQFLRNYYNKENQQSRNSEKVVEYQTYDFLGMRALKANVLKDIRMLVTPVVETHGVCTYRIEPNTLNNGSNVSNAANQGGKSEYISNQHGIIRVNCVDCLDRTNVAQFCIGKAALRLQLQSLHLMTNTDISSSHHSSAPESVLYTELLSCIQSMYSRHGDRIAQQYAGSAAMHKDILDELDNDNTVHHHNVNSSTMIKDINESANNALSFAKRYIANNITDLTKQQAINVFLGHFMVNSKEDNHIWDMEVNTALRDFDSYREDTNSGVDFFYIPYQPSIIESSSQVTPPNPPNPSKIVHKRFSSFYDNKLDPIKLSKLDQEISKKHRQSLSEIKDAANNNETDDGKPGTSASFRRAISHSNNFHTSAILLDDPRASGLIAHSTTDNEFKFEEVKVSQLTDRETPPPSPLLFSSNEPQSPLTPTPPTILNSSSSSNFSASMSNANQNMHKAAEATKNFFTKSFQTAFHIKSKKREKESDRDSNSTSPSISPVLTSSKSDETLSATLPLAQAVIKKEKPSRLLNVTTKQTRSSAPSSPNFLLPSSLPSSSSFNSIHSINDGALVTSTIPLLNKTIDVGHDRSKERNESNEVPGESNEEALKELTGNSPI